MKRRTHRDDNLDKMLSSMIDQVERVIEHLSDGEMSLDSAIAKVLDIVKHGGETYEQVSEQDKRTEDVGPYLQQINRAQVHLDDGRVALREYRIRDAVEHLQNAEDELTGIIVELSAWAYMGWEPKPEEGSPNDT